MTILGNYQIIRWTVDEVRTVSKEAAATEGKLINKHEITSNIIIAHVRPLAVCDVSRSPVQLRVIPAVCMRTRGPVSRQRLTSITLRYLSVFSVE